MALSYALVTPARDEQENLRRLARSICEQTVVPTAWIIVDNGSSDGTADLAWELAERHSWIAVASAPPSENAEPGAPIVRAFHAGLGALESWPDVVVKLDADVSLPPDYFACLMAAFDRDPSLGLASGQCLEDVDGQWRPIHVTGDHVRGATRAYRSRCLRELLPLPEHVGWDTIDEMQAAVRGWRTGIVDEARFYHHRSVGARDRGRAARWRAKGRAAYYLGYRADYLVLRAFFNARSEPAAFAMIAGYFGSSIRGQARHGDRDARAYLRSQQRLRTVAARAASRIASSV